MIVYSRIRFGLFSLLVLAALGPLHAEEAIERFASRITILDGGTVRVEETLRVRAEGDQIKRGIFRDIVRTARGDNPRLDITIEDVRLNGDRVPYDINTRRGSVRIRMGDPDARLPVGEHVFSLIYLAEWAVVFGEAEDRLLWDVTGSASVFPIHKVDVRIALENGAALTRASAAAGPAGSERPVETTRLESGAAVVAYSSGLAPGEGITIETHWPTGLIARPDLAAMQMERLHDRRMVATGLAGSAVLLIFVVAVWLGGRKRTAGIRTTPPKNLSAAACAYILNRRYTSSAFAAAVVSLAAKGALEICDRDAGLTLVRLDAPDLSAASPGEHRLFETLFASGDQVTLDRDHRKTVRRATRAHRAALKKDEARYFAVRRPAALVALAITALVTLAMVYSAVHAGFALAILAVIMMATIMAYRTLQNRYAGLTTKPVWQVLAVIFLIGAGLIALLGVPTTAIGPPFFALIGLMLFVSGLAFLVKSRTPFGARIAAEISAFRDYLKDRDSIRPDETDCTDLDCPYRFERYLAYAIALGVEDKWNDRFAAALNKAARERGQTHYHPFWYHCSHMHSRQTASIGSVLGTNIAGAHAATTGMHATTAASSSVSVGAGGGVGGF